jgi:hypothetical protein
MITTAFHSKSPITYNFSEEKEKEKIEKDKISNDTTIMLNEKH